MAIQLFQKYLLKNFSFTLFQGKVSFYCDAFV